MAPTVHRPLSDDGMHKRLGEDFDESQAQKVLDGLLTRLGSEISKGDDRRVRLGR
ncbi:hypothetical protein ACFSL4_32645 [Streptomyces caeni]|uniref:Uncharacterized protein n=1 Tax=Streptomyces caeni TaxID=2307231 RepID=A0ABW4J0N9_9ACTN